MTQVLDADPAGPAAAAAPSASTSAAPSGAASSSPVDRGPQDDASPSESDAERPSIGAREDYDETHYPRRSQTWTHPRRMAALAELIGLETPDPHHCRILELGCATGSNLIPIAYSLPHSDCVGLDLSEGQIARGNQDIADLGMTNIRLLAMDLRAVGPELGTFDFIICHGIYSWVPPEVRQAILRIVETMLAPTGIAYISYNVNPGWHFQMPLRDAMLYHTRDLPNNLDRARAGVDFLTAWRDGLPRIYAGQAGLIQGALERFEDVAKEDIDGELSYMMHEYLADYNRAYYFHEFAASLESHGLQYLTDGDFATEFPRNLPDETVELIQARSANLIDMLQYLDYFTFRMFRRSLVIHKDRPINRALQPQNLLGLYVHSLADEDQPAPMLNSLIPTSINARGAVRFSTNQPLCKAAMRLLTGRNRSTWRVDNLVLAARDLLLEEDPGADVQLDAPNMAAFLQGLLHAICTSDYLLTVTAGEPPHAVELPERPVVSRFARLQSDSERSLTTLRLERMVPDPMELDLIRTLDGRVTPDEVIAEWRAAVLDGRIVLGKPPMPADEALAYLERAVRERVRVLLHSGLFEREPS